MTASDAELVRDAQAGSRAAVEELVRRTARLVYARLYLDTGDCHRADDLTQETYLRAVPALAKLADPTRFRPWLLTIAHSVLLDAVRKGGRQKRSAKESPLMDVPTIAPMPDEAAATEERRERVLAAVRALPDEYRLPLTLRYLGGADYEDISRQLGLTNGSLRGLLYRGLKLLRDRLPAEFASG